MSYRRYFSISVTSFDKTEGWDFKVILDEVLFGQPYSLVAMLIEKYTIVGREWTVGDFAETDDTGSEVIDKYELEDDTRIGDIVDAASAETIGEFVIMSNSNLITERKCRFKKRRPVSEEFELANEGYSE